EDVGDQPAIEARRSLEPRTFRRRHPGRGAAIAETGDVNRLRQQIDGGLDVRDHLRPRRFHHGADALLNALLIVTGMKAAFDAIEEAGRDHVVCRIREHAAHDFYVIDETEFFTDNDNADERIDVWP